MDIRPSAPPCPAWDSSMMHTPQAYPPIPTSPFPENVHTESRFQLNNVFTASPSSSRVHGGPQSRVPNSPGEFPSSGYKPHGSRNPAAITSLSLPKIEITVSDPRTNHEPSKLAIPGAIMQLRSALVGLERCSFYELSPEKCAFSDFAIISKVTHRGFFTPERPLKHPVHGGKLRPQFIERRRAVLQQYLSNLCSHRVIARSNELATFLQERGDLRHSQTWLSLQRHPPTWVHAMQRLAKQVVGKEALTPPPAEAARATGSSHDIIRSVREAFNGLNRGSYTPVKKESELERRADMVSTVVSTVRNLSWSTNALHIASAARLTAGVALGRAFSDLASLNASAGYVSAAEEAEKLGGGCIGACTSAGDAVKMGSCSAQELSEHARMLGGALRALDTRKEALTTAITIEEDVSRLRGRTEAMQASQHPKRLAALQSLTMAEAALAAAWNEYENIALRNEHDMAGCAAFATKEAWSSLWAWAEQHASAAESEASAWLRIARSLGADTSSIPVSNEVGPKC